MIAQGAQFQAPVDPFAQYGKLQQLQQNQQTNALNQMKMDEYVRGQQESNALRQFLPGLNESNRSQLLGYGAAGQGVFKALGEGDTQRRLAEQARSQADVNKSNILKNAVAQTRDAVAGIDPTDAPSYMALRESVLTQYPELAPHMPAGWNANVKQRLITTAASVLEGQKPGAPSPLARLQSELAALPSGDSRRADYLAAIKKETQFAPPASTTVVLPAQEKAFESGLGAGQSKKILDSKIAAEGALQILQTNDVGRSLLQSGAITGAGANFFVGLNKALKQGGIDFGYADAAANSQAYGSAMAANVGQLIKQFGAGTAISDADRAYATKAAAGEISMDEAAIRKVLDINDRASRNVIERHNKSVRGIKTNIPLEVEIPNAVAPPPAAASQIPTNVAPAAPASNITQQRQDANAAIAKGAPAAAVRQRFKQNTGQEL
jgi:hypothetical protein